MQLIRILLVVIVGMLVNSLSAMESSSIAAASTELKQAITNQDINFICVRRIFNWLLPITKVQNYIQGVFEKINEKIINDDRWTFVIFSEQFWGGATQALASNEVKDIVGQCQALSRNRPKVIIHINFLHKFKVSELNQHNCSWLSMNDDINNYNSNRIFGDLSLDETDFTKSSEKHLSNYSLIIYGGTPIAIYKKSTYANEGDSLIKAGYVYEFGDFKTHAIGNNPFSAIFVGDSAQVATRICADMNEAFLQNIPNVELLMVPANNKHIDNSILNINVNDMIFVDTNPTRLISHLQKLGSNLKSDVCKPSYVLQEKFDEHNGFELYQYNWSDVGRFRNVEIVPERFVPVVDSVECDDGDEDCC